MTDKRERWEPTPEQVAMACRELVQPVQHSSMRAVLLAAVGPEVEALRAEVARLREQAAEAAVVEAAAAERERCIAALRPLLEVLRVECRAAEWACADRRQPRHSDDVAQILALAGAVRRHCAAAINAIRSLAPPAPAPPPAPDRCREALRGLVEALPRCAQCGGVATFGIFNHNESRVTRWCCDRCLDVPGLSEHEEAVEEESADALRAALAALEESDHG